jgi:GAF domain-containing protein
VIAEALEELRAESGSRLALLIPYRDGTLFHSLLLLADVNSRRGKKWQTRLLEAERWADQKRSPLDRFAGAEIDESELLWELRRRSPFRSIAGTLRGDMKVVSRYGEGPPVSPATPTPASVHVILAGPEHPGKPTVEKLLDELMVMVNGSAAAVVNGNLEAERRVDGALDQISRDAARAMQRTNTIDPTVATLKSFAKALLREALELTDSRLGNVYLAHRDAERLELIAHVRNRRPRRFLKIKARGEPARSVVGWVYQRRRPMVINDISEFRRVHPRSKVVDVAGSLGEMQRELAVPIVQHSLAGTETVIGVVNVEKLRREGGGDDGYSHRDVAVLRSVAHRIALWRAYSMVQQSSATIAGLMKRSTSVSDWRDEEREDETRNPNLPSDALAAGGIVQEALAGVHRLTRSYSATLRLLSPDCRRITRFAAHPPGRLDDPAREIDVDDRESVVAWVIRNGEPCYLWNVRDRAARRAYPGLDNWTNVGRGTVSELCLPVFIGGRVVGALDLEGRFPHGYVDSLGIAVAVAEQLGLAIQYSRRFHEQEVLSMGAATTANVHELGKLGDRLRTLARKEGRAISGPLSEIAGGIVECSRSGADLPELEPMTTPALVQRVLKDLSLEDVFTVYEEPSSPPVHNGADALALRSALMAIVDNANGYHDKKNPGCEIAWRNTAIGGKPYVTILVRNNVELQPGDEQVAALFRLPLRREGGQRTGLGAFTAGALVRSLGGDVYVARNAEKKFTVGIDLPVDAAPGKSREAA